jgi:hypothetical protein
MFLPPVAQPTQDLARVQFYYGLSIYIENPEGSIRKGKDWASRAPAHYGYIFGYFGADGDEMDCYIGPHLKTGKVYIVDQNKINSETFDEHKCMIGYHSQQEALEDYFSGHSRGKSIFRGVTQLTPWEFQKWLRFGNHKTPLSEQTS